MGVNSQTQIIVEVTQTKMVASAFASTFGASPSTALPKLTAPLPVTFALSASKPPGMSKFFAT